MQPPAAKQVPHVRSHHGHDFVDDYEWLRDKDSPEVRAHLEAENAYTEARTAHLETLRGTIFSEIRTRIKETDMSVPVRRGNWWYFARTKAGSDYSVQCRVPVSGLLDRIPPEVGEDALPGEQVVLDSNAEAVGGDFFSLGSFSLSGDGNLLAWAADVTGDERYTLRIRDLSTGEDLPDTIPGTFAGACFEPSGRYVFYTTVDEAWRPDTVWRHEVGTDASADVAVFTEPDERFFVGVGLSRSRKYIFFVTDSKVTSGYWTVPAEDPTAEPRIVRPRVEGVEYGVDHVVVTAESGEPEDRFLVWHNESREDFELVDVPVSDPASGGRPVLDDPTGKRIDDVEAFAGHLVVSYRSGGFARVGIVEILGGTHPWGPLREIASDETISTTVSAGNPEFHDDHVRIVRTSYVTPRTVLDHDMTTGTSTVLKRQPVLGGVDLDDYAQDLLWVTAEDGTQIPVSIVRNRKLVKSGQCAPTVLYGYGSYEASMDPSFSVARLSLLDRGVVFALAHVRGGGEMGRHWYDQGKTLAKRNTFTDFIAAARHLVDSGHTIPATLVATGGSAGGLLMGAVANMAPELFAGISAHVPFVDALTSILMPELPLTVTEWDEWGDPLHDAQVYEYMRSYSPYENVVEQEYPRILALTSLNDTRVLYVEPAKWVAKLREVGADALLKTEMAAGHGGASGRYDAWRETAFDFAWILDVLGKAE